MAPFDRSHTTSYQSSIISITQPCTIFELLDVEIYVSNHSTSLEAALFKNRSVKIQVFIQDCFVHKYVSS